MEEQVKGYWIVVPIILFALTLGGLGACETRTQETSAAGLSKVTLSITGMT